MSVVKTPLSGHIAQDVPGKNEGAAAVARTDEHKHIVPAPPPSLVNLPPDLLAECLHNLPPADICCVSMRLSKSSRCEAVSEDASLLAIEHIVKRAETWTREQNVQAEQIDPEAVEVRRILKDHPVFANLSEASSGGDTDRELRLLEGETWLVVHKLLSGVMKRVGADTADTSMLIWIFFGFPNLPLISKTTFFRLDDLASAIATELCAIRMPKVREWLKTRAIQCALRCANVAGCYKGASDILHEIIDGRIMMEAYKDVPVNVPVIRPKFRDPTPLDLDIVIFMVKLGVDGYSRGHVVFDVMEHHVSQEEAVANRLTATKQLVEAVRFGRWAVAKAKKRFKAFLKNRMAASEEHLGQGWANTRDESCPYWTANNSEGPMLSIFRNDTIRLVNAQLGLKRAISFLAERVALGSSPVRALGIFPSDYSVDDRRRAIERPSANGTAEMIEACRMSRSFLKEAQAMFSEMAGIMKEQLKFMHRDKADCPFIPNFDLIKMSLGTTTSEGELYFCASRANAALPIAVLKIDGDDPVAGCIAMSITEWGEALNGIMCGIQKNDKHLHHASVNNAIEIAKGFGMTLSFAEQIEVARVEASSTAGLYLDFAYILSCFCNGTGPPMASMINSLDMRPEDEIGSIEDRCSRLVDWLDHMLGRRFVIRI